MGGGAGADDYDFRVHGTVGLLGEAQGRRGDLLEGCRRGGLGPEGGGCCEGEAEAGAEGGGGGAVEGAVEGAGKQFGGWRGIGKEWKGERVLCLFCDDVVQF